MGPESFLNCWISSRTLRRHSSGVFGASSGSAASTFEADRLQAMAIRQRKVRDAIGLMAISQRRRPDHLEASLIPPDPFGNRVLRTTLERIGPRASINAIRLPSFCPSDDNNNTSTVHIVGGEFIRAGGSAEQRLRLDSGRWRQLHDCRVIARRMAASTVL